MLRDGIPGVLSLEPVYMMTDWRLLAVLQIIKHQRLYEAFGSWRDWLGGTGRVSRRATFSLVDLEERQKRAYRRRSLARANQVRREEAEGRRQEPLEVARQVWPVVKQQASGRRGRPPLRQLLAAMLQQQGVECSDRDLRYMMSQLQQEESDSP